MKSKTIFLLWQSVVIVSLLLAGCGSPTATPEIVLSASLTELQGLVEIKNPGQADFAAATSGDSLQVQGQVSTGEDGRAAIELSTGSIVRVAPSSLYTLEANEVTETGLFTRLKLEMGKLWIVLNGGSIDVDTPSGLATVRGSYMSVWLDPDTGDVWVGCLEGWCQAGNDTDSLDLIAGQGTILYAFDPAGTTPPPPPLLRTLTQAEIDEFLANNPELADVMDAIIATASALPGNDPTATPTATFTSTPSCFPLTSPADGAEVANVGPVVFTWGEQAGAKKYEITFSLPNGYQLTFHETGTAYTRYMDAFPAAGTYQWQVTAFDAAGAPLCTAGPFAFSKAALPTPTRTLPASFPAPPTTTGATITFIQAPVGIDLYSTDCAQNYQVQATDPDGIDTVWVFYEVYDNGNASLLDSGGFMLPYNMTTGYYEITNSTIVTGSLNSSNYIYDIYWHFEVVDLNENSTIGPTYHFRDLFGCFAF